MRLAVAGRHSAWVRIALAAIGTGLGVTVLLLAAAVPQAVVSHGHRADARVPITERRGPTSLLSASVGTEFHGRSVGLVYLRVVGSHPPHPPGVARLPAPGEVVVSPALARLLASPHGALLRPRFPGRPIGTIAAAGLTGPADLIGYIGTDRSAAVLAPTTGFGEAVPSDPYPELLVAVLVVGVTVLLFPVLVFLLAATRLSGGDRDRRLAALRLLGADARQVRRIAAGESLLGSLGGLLVGGAAFVAVRPLVGRVEIDGASVYSSDVVPRPLLAALIAVLIPVLTLAAALVAQRRTIVEPLGVVRQAVRGRRRIWWRLLPGLVGGALLASGVDATSQTRLVIGVVGLLATVPLLLPWAVQFAIGHVRPSAPAVALGVGRLRMDSGPPARVIAGVAVALAGAVGLISILAVASHSYSSSGRHSSTGQISVELSSGSPAPALGRDPDVRGTASWATVPPRTSAAQLVIMSCSDVEIVYPGARCSDGAVFGDGLIHSGEVLKTGLPGDPAWRVSGLSSLPPPWDGPVPNGIVVTPGAAHRAWSADASRTVVARYAAGSWTAVERLRNAFAPAGPGAQFTVVSGPDSDLSTGQALFRAVRAGLYAGAGLVLVVAAATMLLLGVEQVRERRRPLAALAAAGVPRSVLVRSVLWQNAIPLAAGIVLADSVGPVLAVLVLRIAHRPAHVDWLGMGGLTASAVLAVAFATLLTVPAIRSATRPAMLRAE